jgi:hypothetical protein
MRKLLILLFFCIPLFACAAKDSGDKSMLKNTRWTSYNNLEQKPVEFTEINFNADGTVKFNTKDGRESFSSGTGGYTYLPDTKEIFILMKNMSFGFVVERIPVEGGEPLPVYEDIIFSDFQMYYKITEYKDNKVSVEYCHMNSNDHNPAKIWRKEDGIYKLLDDCKMERESFFAANLTTEK